MQKINKILAIFVGFLAIFVIALPAKANGYVLSIQKLPSYINTDTFKLSCTSNGETAQFYISKDGGADVAFGPSINLSAEPCQVQVTGSQMNSETTYKFTVKLNTGESDSTTTIFDKSGPDPISGFSKDGLSDGFRLHYHTPTNDDFSRVIIYRGDVQGFEADSSHEIATVTSSRDSDMTYEDHYGSTENRYYLIRAIDKAGNSSGLAGDGGATTITETVTTSPISGAVTIVPPIGEGSILGEEATPTSTSEEMTSGGALVQKINAFASTQPSFIKWILTHKKITLGLITIAGLLVWRLRQWKKKK